MYLERVGAVSTPSRRHWQPRDCALYALALGAGWEQLAFVTEGSEQGPQRVYPTFVLAGVCAAESQQWPDAGFATGAYEPHQLVLGSHSLELMRPVEPSGDVTVRTRVVGIDDKGSGALVRLEIAAADTATGAPAFTAGISLFVIGAGGFGGDRGPHEPDRRVPRRVPDWSVRHVTSAQQTLLYRHAGNDANAIHVDPVVAERAGFKGPILSGQNTLGFATRAVVHTVAQGDPTRVRSVEGRFAQPGYNGDTLITEMWYGFGVGADERGRLIVAFRVVNQDGAVLIDRGRVTIG
jgi:acyl dehydratase